MSDVITLSNVSITHPGASTPTLRNINLTVAEGDLTLVVGRTGTGKSTLLGTLNGIVPHFSGGRLDGTVTVAGRDTRTHRPRELADVVGVVGQNPVAGFVTDTVEDEIAYGMEQLGISPSVMRKRVEEILDLMGIADLRRRALLSLSGGQQQRVAIAAVLAAQPRILVLDEPTSALDPTAAQDVLASITTLVHDVGLTVILAEHRLERVMHAADALWWLPGDGSVVQGRPEEVLARADVVPPLAALSRAMGWPTVPLSVREARRRVGPRPGLPRAPQPSEAMTWPGGGNEVLRLETLGVNYGQVRAVDALTTTVERGTITCLMGRNGSGKSSLMWAIQGATKSSGRVLVNHEGSWADPRKADAATARRMVSLVPQSASDLLYLPTVAEECAQADKESGVPAGTTRAILSRLRVELPEDRNPRDMSEGQRLALVLAVQLSSRPDVVLLDEPTRGLDYAMKTELTRIVKGIAAGATGDPAAVLLATHDVELAATTTDRTIVMATGHIVADGSTRSVCTSSPGFSPQIAKVFHPADVMTIADVERLVNTPAGDRR